MYRVTQEALTNMVKHARAGVASVLLERARRRAPADRGGRRRRLRPRRRGRGLAPHLGLSGMRERLRLVNGSLQIESAPGAGTTLFIHIPLPPEGAA